MLSNVIPLFLGVWTIYSATKYRSLFALSITTGLKNGAIYALIAFGFGLIYHTTQNLDLAHGDVFMLGTVSTAVILINHLKADSNTPRNWFLLSLTLILVAGIGAILSASTDLIVFRRLRKANRIAPLIASLGVSLILQDIGIKANGSGPKRFHSIIPEAPPYVSMSSGLVHAAIILSVAIPSLAMCSYLATRSHNGLAIQAVAYDYETSQLMGINVNRTITRTFVIAGVAAGIAGVIYAQEFRVSTYALGMHVGLLAYAGAIIGGVNRILGTVLGGFLIGLIEALSAGVPSGLGGRWSETAIYSVFIMMLVYRPHGLFGYKDINE